MAARRKFFRVVAESNQADQGHKGSEPISVRRTSYISF